MTAGGPPRAVAAHPAWSLGTAIACLAVGLASEHAAFGWDQPLNWVPDLITGLTFIGAGIYAWPRRRGTAALLMAIGLTWFAGGFAGPALYWHRGLLVHLILVHPGFRPRAKTEAIAVAIGYGASLVPLVWRTEVTSVVLALALVAVAVHRRLGATGQARIHRGAALQAAVAVAAVLLAGTAARLAFPVGDAVIPALLAYEAVLCGVAVGLARPVGQAVTDLVVELGETRSGTLRDALAATLGDPSLRVGYWRPETGDYADAEGRPVPLPEPDTDLGATVVELPEPDTDLHAATAGKASRPFAVIVHDRAVLGDPVLAEAVTVATRLTAANAALQGEIRTRVADLSASRRRLLVAADEERARLEQRLHDGPLHRLAALRSALPSDGPGANHLRRAIGHLDRVLDELRELGQGLHPRELGDGLAPALETLAGRSPVPLRLAVPDGRFPAEIEAAAYYVCAEALANVAKHAAASAISIQLGRHGDALRVSVTDDGVGGADPSRGTGLTGLADRVEALGGRLTFHPGRGTRLVAEIPLDGEH
jgi:signal transduction histidine kinase